MTPASVHMMPTRPNDHTRLTERRPVTLPARLMWRDQRGTERFASVVARNVCEQGVYVECQSVVSISLFRLVQFQLEREVRASDALPEALRQGRILSAVYRVSQGSSSGTTQGLALRLMVAVVRKKRESRSSSSTTASGITRVSATNSSTRCFQGAAPVAFVAAGDSAGPSTITVARPDET